MSKTCYICREATHKGNRITRHMHPGCNDREIDQINALVNYKFEHTRKLSEFNKRLEELKLLTVIESEELAKVKYEAQRVIEDLNKEIKNLRLQGFTGDTEVLMAELRILHEENDMLRRANTLLKEHNTDLALEINAYERSHE